MVIRPSLPALSRRRVLAPTRGFTLIELVIVVLIVGILAAIAVPGFAGMIATSRAKTSATDIYLALIKARSSAAKFNTTVAICPTNSSQWQQGWSIAYPACGGTVVSTESGSAPGVTVTLAPTSVLYLSSGRTSAAAQFQISAQAGSTTVVRCVTVNTGGRPYVKQTAC